MSVINEEPFVAKGYLRTREEQGSILILEYNHMKALVMFVFECRELHLNNKCALFLLSPLVVLHVSPHNVCKEEGCFIKKIFVWHGVNLAINLQSVCSCTIFIYSPVLVIS